MSFAKLRFFLSCHTAALAGVALFTGSQAHAAQEHPSAENQDDAPAPGEIIVVAQKRVQRLQDVPLAVSVASGQDLAARNINDTASLVRAMPALSFQQGPNATNSAFRIRGIGSAVLSLGVESAVGMIIDGVVGARQVQNFADFADIERIEVLRGPQGTLFGKNATAGAINIVTAAPTKTLTASGSITIAEGNEYRTRATISGPLTENLRARLTGYYNHVGGHYYNSTLGRNAGGSEGFGLRGKLEWDVTPDFNLLLSAEYHKSNADCCRSILVASDNPDTLALVAPAIPSYKNRVVTENVLTLSNQHQTTISLQASWDLGGSTLTSISAYQGFDTFNTLDNDGINTPVPIYTGGGANSAKFDLQEGTASVKNYSQELRIASNSSADLTYVGGVYFSHLDLERDFTRRRAYCSAGTLGAPCATPYTNWQSAKSFADLTTDHLAGFGQVEYRLIGGLSAIAGVRLQYEKVGLKGRRIAPLFIGDTIPGGHDPVTGYRSTSDTSLTGNLGAKYSFSRRAQAYFTYTRGYKGEGFDSEITADFANQEPVKPEHVNAYELGFKGSTSDNKFSIAIAAFWTDYSNLQITANRSNPDTGAIVYQLTNAGSSNTKGVELEGSFRPSSHFSVSGTASYTKARLSVDGLSCPLQFQAAAPVLSADFPTNTCYIRQYTDAAGQLVRSGAVQDVRNGRVPYSPDWRFLLSTRYENSLGNSGYDYFIQADANWQSRQSFAVEQDPLLKQDAYAIVDASIGVNSKDGRYSASLFVRNLFDKNYVSALYHGIYVQTSTVKPYDLYALFNKDSQRFFGGSFAVKF